MSEFLNPIGEAKLDETNRGYQNEVKESDFPPIGVSLLSIDTTIIEYVREIINPQVLINGNLQPVPIVYGTPERWATFQKYGYIREARSEQAQTPLIMIRRTGISRGAINNPNNKYLYRSFENGWNSKNMYDRFAIQNRITPSKKIRSVIIPDYIKLNYQIIIWTDLIEQLNTLIETINVENDEYWGKRNNYKFRVRIDDYTDDSQLPPDDKRAIRASFNMIVDAYLLPEKVIQKFKASSTNQDEYTKKKIVTIVEVDGERNSRPDNL